MIGKLLGQRMIQFQASIFDIFLKKLSMMDDIQFKAELCIFVFEWTILLTKPRRSKVFRQARNFWIKYILVCIVAFVVLPTLIYSASHIQYLTVKNRNRGFDALIQRQVNMYNYHSRLTAKHAYSSNSSPSEKYP